MANSFRVVDRALLRLLARWKSPGFVAWAALLLLSGILRAGDAAAPFTVIVLPDTQNYVKYEGAEKKLFAQAQWIKDNREKLNIKFVIHEGDMTDDNSPGQWEKAREAIKVLDGVVPYAPCVGNHDAGHNGPKTSLLTEYFKPSELEKLPGWGGKMPEDDCFWFRFDAGAEKFLVLSLGLGPSDAMLKWADQIIESHPGYKVLMATHEYVGKDGNLSGKDTKKNAAAYGLHRDGSPRNTGAQIWDKHVRKHAGYQMVFCGHYDGIAARNSMKGDSGNTVHQMMANYQYFEGGGNGFLRILRFLPAEKKCVVQTYSPFVDKYLKDDQNEFSLDLAQ
ncbi:MAG: metallophosphoesterase [Verrucomicrobiae bacterium]